MQIHKGYVLLVDVVNIWYVRLSTSKNTCDEKKKTNGWTDWNIKIENTHNNKLTCLRYIVDKKYNYQSVS